MAAIRAFLSPFRLPGEAQKIDRIMCEFAARFCGQVLIPPSDPLGGTPSSRWCAPSLSAVQNVGVFADPDAAYVLGFSVIMLNTDAHSSQIKHKMTKQEFVRNNRGINAGGDPAWWSKWPSWLGHSWPPQARQTASRLGAVASALVRSHLSPQIPPGRRDLGATPRQTHRFRGV